MQQRKSIINHKLTLGVGIVGSLNMSTIFTLFLKDVFRKMLEETARFILFPLAAAFSIIEACLAWRQASLERGKKGTVAKALVETAAAIAITTAVIGALVTTTLFSFAAPIIFTATLAAKTLFHFGAACYYWGKSAVTTDETKKSAYRAAARGNLVAATALALSTVAVAGVMLLAKPLMAIIGITAGFIAVSYSVYTGAKTPTPPKGYRLLNEGTQPQSEHKLDSEKSNQRTLSKNALLQQSFSKGLEATSVSNQPSSDKEPQSPNDKQSSRDQSKIKPLWHNIPRERELKGKPEPQMNRRERSYSI